jgi:hypothetical protein
MLMFGFTPTNELAAYEASATTVSLIPVGCALPENHLATCSFPRTGVGTGGQFEITTPTIMGASPVPTSAAIAIRAVQSPQCARAGRRDAAGLLFAAGVAAVVILVAIFISTPPDSPTRNAKPYTPLSKAFGLFRSTPEVLPPRVVNSVRDVSRGLDLQYVQLLPGTHPAAWSFPVGRFLCLLSRDPTGQVASSCSPIQRAIQRGMFLTLLSTSAGAPKRRTVGLVRDGVSKVAVRTPGFPTQVAPVNWNVFSVRDAIPEPPEELGLLR